MAHVYNNYLTESDNYGYFTERRQRNKDDYTTQYAEDYNHLEEMRRRQEEGWRQRRDVEEAALMKHKPRTSEYRKPYDEYNPPRDINRFFHDSKYVNPDHKPEEKPEDEYFNDTVPFHRNPNTALTTYDRQYMVPRRDASQQPAGGLYILRYHDSGYKSVDVALKCLQTIVNSFGGFMLGIATRENVFVISGDMDWMCTKQHDPRRPHDKQQQPPQQQKQRRHINLPCTPVDNSVAMLWFPSRDKAFDFSSNSFRNPFKEQGFPTQHGFECHYIPMVTPPMLKSFDTYMFVEVVDKIDPQRMQQFEAELSEAMSSVVNNSLPMVVSCIKGRDSFKPGTWFKHNSKILISRFNNMDDVAEVWNRGCLQRTAHKYGLDVGRMNISAVSLKD